MVEVRQFLRLSFTTNGFSLENLFIATVKPRLMIPRYCGHTNGHKNFQLLAKFGLCSIFSQNLDKYSVARARKIFAIARICSDSRQNLLD